LSYLLTYFTVEHYGCFAGDYHTAISRKDDGRMTFNAEAFIASRPAKFRQMLSSLLSSQSFHQFIDEKIDFFNSRGAPPEDLFEKAISHRREVRPCLICIAHTLSSFSGSLSVIV